MGPFGPAGAITPGGTGLGPNFNGPGSGGAMSKAPSRRMSLMPGQLGSGSNSNLGVVGGGLQGGIYEFCFFMTFFLAIMFEKALFFSRISILHREKILRLSFQSFSRIFR